MITDFEMTKDGKYYLVSDENNDMEAYIPIKGGPIKYVWRLFPSHDHMELWGSDEDTLELHLSGKEFDVFRNFANMAEKISAALLFAQIQFTKG